LSEPIEISKKQTLASLAKVVAALNKTSRLSDIQCFGGLNHFEIMEAFGDANSPLSKAIAERMS
jgi:hypothetical protein